MEIRKMLAKELRLYVEKKHTQEECIGFTDGFERVCDILESALENKAKNEQSNCNILHVSNLLNCEHEWSFDTFDCYGMPLSKYCTKCGITEAI